MIENLFKIFSGAQNKIFEHFGLPPNDYREIPILIKTDCYWVTYQVSDEECEVYWLDKPLTPDNMADCFAANFHPGNMVFKQTNHTMFIVTDGGGKEFALIVSNELECNATDIQKWFRRHIFPGD